MLTLDNRYQARTYPRRPEPSIWFVWKEILIIIEGLFIPLLLKLLSDLKPLSDGEVDPIFK
ncbi:hypothetical protein F5141DRAFT_1096601 [Pisolithus sp. B1]|nr:hypothetical protein F5141DRAFT_1096601 [Pisolithus sp. B1]